jgi:hypothetical protein
MKNIKNMTIFSLKQISDIHTTTPFKNNVAWQRIPAAMQV